MSSQEPVASAAFEVIRPVAELFTGGVRALWATTYTIDLALFNEYLLSRLGEPPLNITILADHRRLSASLARIAPEQTATLAAVNRRWLLRGIDAGGQAFHPKTYLAVTPAGATLLVGSGNLTLGGLDEGREVFTALRSGTPDGDAALSTWQAWIRQIIERTADPALAERFSDLETQLPPPAVAPAALSPLLHNLEVSIASQLSTFIHTVTGTVDELLLTAPFYDEDAAAVGWLLGQFAPASVHVFVTKSTSVNGLRLSERLAASGAMVTVSSYDPDRFVHAKLVGLIAGTRGWLLSGSPNLSQAALNHAASGHGNVEVAVLTTGSPAGVRAAFLPPGVQTAEHSLVGLQTLTFRADPEPHLPAVRLMSATGTQDGCIEIVSQPPAENGWLLDDLTERQPITVSPAGRAVTSGPLRGRLVQLASAAGQIVSGRAVVDDPAALAAVLATGPAAHYRDRPPELTAGDESSPVGRALMWLHRNLVMDVSETAGPALAQPVTAEEASNPGDETLWERLDREHLAHDPRAGIYPRLWPTAAGDRAEPVIELLATMRDQAPHTPAHPGGSPLSRLVHLAYHRDERPGQDEPGLRWAPATRVRVRARNVLRRWATAQADPRLTWVDPLAPAGNFAMIACMLAWLRVCQARGEPVELTDSDLDTIWNDWLRAIAGSGQSDGWLGLLSPATRAQASKRVPPWLPEIVAALCWLIIQPGTGLRERVVAIQPVLAAALSHDLVEPTGTTAAYLSVVTGNPVTCEQIDEQLLQALDYIDDPLWCARIAAELHLAHLKLQAPPGAAALSVRLDVDGISDPLTDPRVPPLVTAVRRYRHRDGVALYAADGGWRLTFASGQAIAYLPSRDHEALESASPFSAQLLDDLMSSAGVLASLFPVGDRVV